MPAIYETMTFRAHWGFTRSEQQKSGKHTEVGIVEPNWKSAEDEIAGVMAEIEEGNWEIKSTVPLIASEYATHVTAHRQVDQSYGAGWGYGAAFTDGIIFLCQRRVEMNDDAFGEYEAARKQREDMRKIERIKGIHKPVPDHREEEADRLHDLQLQGQGLSDQGRCRGRSRQRHRADQVARQPRSAIQARAYPSSRPAQRVGVTAFFRHPGRIVIGRTITLAAIAEKRHDRARFAARPSFPLMRVAQAQIFVPVEPPQRRAILSLITCMAARLAGSGTAIIRSTSSRMKDFSTRGRPIPSINEVQLSTSATDGIDVMAMEDGGLGVCDAKPGVKSPIADIAPDSGGGAACAGADHHPFRHGMQAPAPSGRKSIRRCCCFRASRWRAPHR